MTPEQLRDLIPPAGSPLDLDLATLDSPDLSASVGRFLPGGRLRLDAVTQSQWTFDGVTVTGHASTGPFAATTVTAEFAVVGDQAALKLRATGEDGWTFTAGFPILAGSIYDALVFNRPELVLDWGRDVVQEGSADPLTTYLTFTGTLVINARTILLDVLVPGRGHELSGVIDMISGVPGVDDLTTRTVPMVLLRGPESEGPTLGPLRIQSLWYELRTSPSFNAYSTDLDVAPRVHFAGEVTSAQGYFGPVFIYGSSAEPSGDLMLTAAFEGPDDAGRAPDDGDAGLPMSLSSVLGMTGHAPSLPSVLPSSLPIRLVRITTRVSTSPTIDVSMLTFLVQADVGWDIVPGLFKLEAVDLSLTVANLLTSPVVTGTLSGLVGIGDSGTLVLATDLGAEVFSGSLREGDPPLKIREVYQHLTGSDPGHLPDLEVAKFEIAVIPPRGGRPLAFKGAVEVDGAWTAGPVTVSAISFAVENDGVATSFRAASAFAIGDTEVKVTAAYDPDPAKKWQFSGASGLGRRIAIGDLIAALSADFAGPATFPKPLRDLVVQNLGASFSSGSDHLFVTAQASFPVDSTEVDIAVALTIAPGADRFDGSITAIAGGTAYGFDAHFAQDHGVDLLAASYTHRTSDPLPDLRTLIAALAPTAAAFIPPGVSVDLEDVVFGAGAAYVLSAGLKATVDLSGLPLVGEHLVGDRKVGFDPLRVTTATGALPAADVATLNGLLPQGVSPFPARDMAAGFVLDGTLLLGPLENPVALPVSDGKPAPALPDPPPAQSPGGQNAVWFAVQRGLGPVHIERVGLTYQHTDGHPPQLGVLVDGTVSVAGLSLSLDGLQASVPLTLPVQAPAFDLHGLGVSFSEGPVSVSGSFVKDTIVYNGTTYPSYNGRASISTEALTLGAIGSYAQLPAGPSMFVYAVLDHEFGGPPFFFVTGLAAGFGYNRRLTTPDVTKIADFPLVQEALGTRPPGSLAAEMKALEPYITPSEGDGFVVAGIRFSTFKMIDSFLLAAVSFGGRFEIDLLGLSTLVLPVPDATRAAATPIAEVQLALKAVFAPDDGYFSLIAQLTPNSYLLSKACHLTGGLAFTTWFDGAHKGDFVLTVGGYHPAYAKPPHYPSVPRLGFSWQVNDKLSMRGGAYYALTPSALMAGASIAVNYLDGSLHAWFDASMDFLIAWQPYHYDARFHVSVGASYTFSFFGTHTVNAHVDTDVHLWGPDFAGTARVDIKVISFTIPFGSSSPNTAPTIPWSQVRSTLLPPTTLSVAVKAGATAMGTGDDLGVVDPATLELVTDSLIPATAAKAGNTALPKAGGTYGAAPSAITTGITSTHHIQIVRANGVGAESDFDFTPITKALPSALWGTDPVVSLHRPEMTAPLLTGYHVAPKPHKDGASLPLARAALAAGSAAYTEHTIDWQPADTYIEMTRGDKWGLAILDPHIATARAAIAAAVIKDPEFSFTGFDATAYAEIPYLDYHA